MDKEGGDERGFMKRKRMRNGIDDELKIKGDGNWAFRMNGLCVDHLLVDGLCVDGLTRCSLASYIMTEKCVSLGYVK